MAKQRLKIAHLYPVEMNIYGDTGNVLVLKKRLEWRGMEADIRAVGPGDALDSDVDIIVAGGGQDRGASTVEDDLLKRQKQLQAMHDNGVAMLLICGTYQLFGHRFVTHKNESIQGIGVLDIETFAGDERLIGNIVTTTEWGRMVGYENHSGLTYLGSGAQQLGEVLRGAGNNGNDRGEGAVSNNVFGTYLHGPILPKNPAFADHLIRVALERKFGDTTLKPLDDAAEYTAQATAAVRPR